MYGVVPIFWIYARILSSDANSFVLFLNSTLLVQKTKEDTGQISASCSCNPGALHVSRVAPYRLTSEDNMHVTTELVVWLHGQIFWVIQEQD